MSVQVWVQPQFRIVALLLGVLLLPSMACAQAPAENISDAFVNQYRLTDRGMSGKVRQVVEVDTVWALANIPLPTDQNHDKVHEGYVPRLDSVIYRFDQDGKLIEKREKAWPIITSYLYDADGNMILRTTTMKPSSIVRKLARTFEHRRLSSILFLAMKGDSMLGTQRIDLERNAAGNLINCLWNAHGHISTGTFDIDTVTEESGRLSRTTLFQTFGDDAMRLTLYTNGAGQLLRLEGRTQGMNSRIEIGSIVFDTNMRLIRTFRRSEQSTAWLIKTRNYDSRNNLVAEISGHIPISSDPGTATLTPEINEDAIYTYAFDKQGNWIRRLRISHSYSSEKTELQTTLRYVEYW